MTPRDLRGEIDGMEYPLALVEQAAVALMVVAEGTSESKTGDALWYVAETLQALARDLSDRRDRAWHMAGILAGDIQPEPEPTPPTDSRPTLGLVEGGRREP